MMGTTRPFEVTWQNWFHSNWSTREKAETAIDQAVRDGAKRDHFHIVERYKW